MSTQQQVLVPGIARRGTIGRHGWLNAPLRWLLGDDRYKCKYFCELPSWGGAAGCGAHADQYLGRCSESSILVFVHGYNTGFNAAVLRAAQIAHGKS